MILDFLNIGSKLIDKLIPDPAQKAQAQQALIKLQQDGELDKIQADMESTRIQLSAINAEATSSDKWTSRARPCFLYMVYILILAGIPMGVLSAFSPTTASNIAAGFSAWLHAIPEQIVTLFGVGYLGYTGMRTIDKFKSNQ